MGNPIEPHPSICDCVVAFQETIFFSTGCFRNKATCLAQSRDYFYMVLTMMRPVIMCREPVIDCGYAYCIYVLSDVISWECFDNGCFSVTGTWNLVGFNSVCDLEGMTPVTLNDASILAIDYGLDPLPDGKYEPQPDAGDGNHQIILANWRDKTNVLIKYNLDE